MYPCGAAVVATTMHNVTVAPPPDIAARSHPRNRAMKIGLIDTHVARQQAIHSAHFQSPVDLRHQLFPGRH